jgi:uncharacterized glyoxalase superfamily protein PhnB
MKTRTLFLALVWFSVAAFSQQDTTKPSTSTHQLDKHVAKGAAMESLSPNIFVKDINATIAFYKILGFELTMTVPEKGDYVWVMMTCGSVAIMFQTFASLGDALPDVSRRDGGSLLLYIKLKNIRAFFTSVKDKVTVLKGLEKTFYGATEFSIKDINGYILTFAEDE